MGAYVSREVVRLGAIGLVAVAAISMGAATIHSAVQVGDPGGQGDPTFGPGDEQEQQSDEGEGDSDEQVGPDEQGDQTGGPLEVTRCVRPLAEWYGALLYFGAFGGVLYLAKRRYSFGAAFMGAYAASPVVFLAYFLGTDCATVGGPAPGEGGSGGGLSDVAGTSLVSPEVSPLAFAGLFGLLLAATAAVLIRASGDGADVAADDEDDGSSAERDVSDLAAAAGAAADRLEDGDADVDNEVYRAWWEMISLLDVSDPDSYTPGEFADAAVDLGMDADDVGQLTTLFEEVRYGERDPESREDRAIEVFRAIERQYGDREDDDGR